MNYLFGPVASRRLGRSLGIDLLPYKTCSFNCVYCECGPTTAHQLTRSELVPTAEVTAELDVFLGTKPDLDWVTFSGAGEPTLHTGIGTIINHLKDRHPGYPVAVLTNSTLLGDPQVRKDLLRADLVVPTLNSVVPVKFEAICRPVDGVDLSAVTRGLAAFRREFKNSLVIEVFVVPGVNDDDASVEALRKELLAIGPDAVQLNKLDRPGSEPWVTCSTTDYLEILRTKLAPLQVQLVRSRSQSEKEMLADPLFSREILGGLHRGPASLKALGVGLGVREGDLAKVLGRLVQAGRVLVSGQGADRIFSLGEP